MSEDSVLEARKALRDLAGVLSSLPRSSAAPLEESLRRLATAVEGIEALEARIALQQSLLDDRLLRIETNKLITLWSRLVRGGLDCCRRVRALLMRSPARTVVERISTGHAREDAQYAVWVAHEQAGLPDLNRASALADSWSRQTCVSVLLVPRSRAGLASSLSSVQDQAYRNWELCLAVDERDVDWALPLLSEADDRSGRIQYAITPGGLDTASALNAVAETAQGEFLTFVEDGDVLSPWALFYTVEALQSFNFDLLYWDEDAVDSQGRRFRPMFKPDWSPDLLHSCMYLGNSLTVKRERFFETGGFSADRSESRLYDLALRLADRNPRVNHVARILYHATAERSTDDRSPSDEALALTITDAIFRSEGFAVRCEPGPVPHTFLVRRKRAQMAGMAAIVCSKSPGLLAKCLRSLRSTAASAVQEIVVVAHEESGPNAALRAVIRENGAKMVSFGGAFNFSTMSNLGAAAATAPYLLFLNDDVTATSPEWAEMLAEQLARDEVGVAGSVLWYPTGVLQHAGITVGQTGGGSHVGRFMCSSELWPWLLVTRNVSAVTGACLAIRAELFQTIGGLDPQFSVEFNDIDLCFRVRAIEKRVVCVPVPGLIHAECQSRRGVVRFEERYRFHRKWESAFSCPDPFYSPSLAPTDTIALSLGPN